MVKSFVKLGLAFLFSLNCAKAVHLTITSGTNGIEHSYCKSGAEAWAKETGNTVEIIPVPNDQASLAYYQQMLAAESSEIDVIKVDVVWPSILADHLLDLTNELSADERKRFIPMMLENNTVDGKIIALPWYADIPLLYVRKDLLDKYNRAIPTTWQELKETAEIIQNGERAAGNDKMWGFVFQAKAQESLTCNALEWVHSHNGGSIIDAKAATIDNPKALQALETAASWIGTITPTGVLNYNSEDSRGVFQSGNAVFMRNWQYCWPLLNNKDSPIAGKVVIVPLPKGGVDGKHSGTLGGWQLAVSKYSKHPQEAISLIKYLTSYTEQKRRAIKGGYIPTILALYKDSEVVASQPFFKNILPAVQSAVYRPAKLAGNNYSQISTEFFNCVHATLEKKDNPKTLLTQLAARLNQILGRT